VLLAEAAALRGRGPLRLSDEAAALLRRYAWPGNVRELRASVERAALLADSEVVGTDRFLVEADRVWRDSDGDGLGAESLQGAEKRHIAAVIRRYPTMEEAARALGVDAVTLWRRRRKYGLE
jgi:NtrC-family two-component system response regulator AlgB